MRILLVLSCLAAAFACTEPNVDKVSKPAIEAPSCVDVPVIGYCPPNTMILRRYIDTATREEFETAGDSARLDVGSVVLLYERCGYSPASLQFVGFAVTYDENRNPRSIQYDMHGERFSYYCEPGANYASVYERSSPDSVQACFAPDTGAPVDCVAGF